MVSVPAILGYIFVLIPIFFSHVLWDTKFGKFLRYKRVGVPPNRSEAFDKISDFIVPVFYELTYSGLIYSMFYMTFLIIQIIDSAIFYTDDKQPLYEGFCDFFFTNSSPPYSHSSIAIGRGFGHASMTNFFLLALPVTRSGIWTTLCRIPFERALKFHRFLFYSFSLFQSPSILQ